MRQDPIRPEDVTWDDPASAPAASPTVPAAPGPTPQTTAAPPTLGGPFDLDTPVTSTGLTPREMGAHGEGVGRVAGSALATYGPPALEIAGSVLGGGLMGKGASFLNRAIGAGAGQAVGTASRTLVGQPPPSLQDVGWSAASGAAGEAAFPLVGKIAKPFASRLAEHGPEVLTYFGGKATPGQVSDSGALHFLENIMEGSLFGGSRYKKFLAEQDALLKQKADEILGQFGPKTTVEEAGKGYQAALEAAHDTARTTASKLYDDVDALSGGVQVSLDPLRQFVEDEALRRGKLGMALAPGQVKQTGAAVMHATASEAAEAVSEPAGMALLRNVQANAAEAGGTTGSKHSEALLGELRDILASVENLTPEQVGAGRLTFRQAHEVRAAIGRRIRNAQASNSPEAKNAEGFLEQLYGRLDDAMTAAAGKDTPLANAYGTATTAWRKMITTYEKGLLRDIAKAKPEVVVRDLIKPGRVGDIEKARTEVGAEGWKAVQRAHAKALFRGKGDDLVTGAKLTDRLHDLTPETMAAIYPRGTDEGIWQLARVLKQVQSRKSWGKTGSIAIHMMQGGAILAAATGNLSPGGAMLLISPAALSRIALTPMARKWMTVGLQNGATDIGARATSQLAAWLMKEGLIDRHRPAMTPGPAQPTLPAAPASGRGGGPGQGPPSLGR